MIRAAPGANRTAQPQKLDVSRHISNDRSKMKTPSANSCAPSAKVAISPIRPDRHDETGDEQRRPYDQHEDQDAEGLKTFGEAHRDYRRTLV
jgi:hypothetical protein